MQDRAAGVRPGAPGSPTDMNTTTNLRLLAGGVRHPARLAHRFNDVQLREERQHLRYERREYRRVHRVPSAEMVRRVNAARWNGAATPGMCGWDPGRNRVDASVYERLWGPPTP